MKKYRIKCNVEGLFDGKKEYILSDQKGFEYYTHDKERVILFAQKLNENINKYCSDKCKFIYSVIEVEA